MTSPWIDTNRCINCGMCVDACPNNAVDFISEDELFEKARKIVRQYLQERDRKLAEYARLKMRG